MSIDTTSATWRAIKEHAQKELIRAREDLEYVGVTPERANQCRGSIEQLKALLDLPNLKKGIKP